MDADTRIVVTLLFAEQLQLHPLLRHPADSLTPTGVMAEYTEGFIRSLHLSGVHQPQLETQLRATLRQVQAAWVGGS